MEVMAPSYRRGMSQEDEEPPPLPCPECAALVAPESGACPACGTELDPEGAVAAAASAPG
jgi:uncharacterized OB-fold protein